MNASQDRTIETISEENVMSDEDLDVSPPKKSHLSRECQLEELLRGLKNKYNSLAVNDPLRVSILTIAPDCWSLREIANEFGTSIRMAKKARDLKKAKGILTSPVSKLGKKLPSCTVDKVIKFYENDINSRIMPSTKGVVNIVVDEEKKKVQKRLLLSDISYLHSQFKNINPECSISLSKFAELRPKWCVLAGAKGTHSVCVCTIHENFKAMLDACNLQRLTDNSEYPIKSYKDCFQFVICEDSRAECYFRQCKNCPDFKRFSSFVTDIFENNNIEEIIYSTWQSTDRCTLKKECLDVENFVDKLCEHLEKLLPHHYIANNQATYISERKDNLKKDEMLVHCDFSENYAYITQNAAQAFHFNNNQCTVHPAIFYYRSKEGIKHQSFIVLSDSTAHDTAAVYVLQQLLIPEIKNIVPKVKKIIYVTDGAKQHYKNRFQICNLIHHKEDFGISAE